jgi:hypothetical protein
MSTVLRTVIVAAQLGCGSLIGLACVEAIVGTGTRMWLALVAAGLSAALAWLLRELVDVHGLDRPIVRVDARMIRG